MLVGWERAEIDAESVQALEALVMAVAVVGEEVAYGLAHLAQH